VKSNTSLNISTYGFGEASLYRFFESQVENGRDALSEDFKVVGSEDEISKKLRSIITSRGSNTIGSKENTCSIVGDDDATYLLINGAPSSEAGGVVKIAGGESSSNIKVVAGQHLLDTLGSIIRDNFTLIGAKINWVYAASGDSTSIPVRLDNLPVTEMYPNLCNRSLEEYYDDFMESPASILVLIGPPGTGKTSFLRGLLHHTNSSATVSYDPAILEHDTIFANFMSGHNRFMVLEDSDSFLVARSKGNTIMHKFLNVGDGLVSTRHKKIIFTTNLPSTRDIDPALIRPGRCFDVLHFDKLTPADCNKVLNKLGTNVPIPEEGVTLAELLNPTAPVMAEKKKKARSVGFVQ
jgi:hypothetical protein